MARSVRIRYLSGKPTNWQRNIAEMLKTIAVDVQSLLWDNHRVASGGAVNSFEIQVKDNVFSFLAVDYIEYALFGRGPGKPPPAHKIASWVLIKGIEPPGRMTFEQYVYAIVTNIGKFGTLPTGIEPSDLQAIYDHVYNKFQPILVKSLTRFVVGSLDSIFLKNGWKIVT